MIDPRLQNLAKILVHYSTEIRPKDRVAIVMQPEGTPLALEVYREVLKAGGYPYTVVKLDDQDFVFFSEANDDQLAHINRALAMVTAAHIDDHIAGRFAVQADGKGGGIAILAGIAADG